MGKAEIQQKINRLNREINNLEASKNTYQNMNTKINEAITNLSNAKDYTYKSYSSLGKNYQSKIASKRKNELENEYTNITNIINDLKNKILVASNNKITSIKSDISSKQSQISRLREQMKNMDN